MVSYFNSCIVVKETQFVSVKCDFMSFLFYCRWNVFFLPSYLKEEFCLAAYLFPEVLFIGRYAHSVCFVEKYI